MEDCIPKAPPQPSPGWDLGLDESVPLMPLPWDCTAPLAGARSPANTLVGADAHSFLDCSGENQLKPLPLSWVAR